MKRKDLLLAGVALAVVLAILLHTLWSAEPIALPAIAADRIEILQLGPLPPIRAGNRLLITPLYAASLNPATKFADWVRYRVTPGWFSQGNALERNWRTDCRDEALENADYAGAPYDRGHLIPLASVAGSPDAWTANLLEVIAPQTANLNQGPWLRLEEHVRDLARREGCVLVTAGTLYASPQRPLPAADEPHQVPSHFWLSLHCGNANESYLVPQTVARDATLQSLRVPGDALERRTFREK